MIITISNHELLVFPNGPQSPDAFDRSKTRVNKPAPKSHKTISPICIYLIILIQNHCLKLFLLSGCTHRSYVQFGVKEWFALWPKEAQYFKSASNGWGTSITVSSSSEIVLPFNAQSLLSTWWHIKTMTNKLGTKADYALVFTRTGHFNRCTMHKRLDPHLPSNLP